LSEAGERCSSAALLPARGCRQKTGAGAAGMMAPSQNFREGGVALNDDLRAVLGKGWGVGYAYMYIECHGDRARPSNPLRSPARAGNVRRRLENFCSFPRTLLPQNVRFTYTDFEGLFGSGGVI